ncbi:MAG: D-cysteine desulfhydrase family protein [Gammaproteobacteria bacterium]|nr:D-cysteine desulfhydrase family protein [Gammaproteobacteria bacterium]
MKSLDKILAAFPRARLAHTPTPLQQLPRLSADFGRALYVKRDDCTGLAMGGNKARQLEFYLGEAVARGADCVLSTGAVQSNALRTLAAGAAKLGLECHVQLESRVDNPSDDYLRSGNVLLDRLFGAHVHRLAVGEDEERADHALAARAEALRAAGKQPFIIPLGAEHTPTGALGYVAAAAELAAQIARQDARIDLIAVGSGSGLTHAGLLTGLALLDVRIPVLGVCVRRGAELQRRRVLARCRHLAELLGVAAVHEAAVRVDDSAFAPGYGRASKQTLRDLQLLATREGLLTDPAYSAKTFSAVFNLIRAGRLSERRRIAVIHTGGTPALFGYRRELTGATGRDST